MPPLVGFLFGVMFTLSILLPYVEKGIQSSSAEKVATSLCEAGLPSDQHCEVVITAKVVDNE
jgi:hypothetical protein